MPIHSIAGDNYESNLFRLFTLFNLVGCDFLEDATMTLNAEPEIPVFNGTLNDAMVQAKGQEEKGCPNDLVWLVGGTV